MRSPGARSVLVVLLSFISVMYTGESINAQGSEGTPESPPQLQFGIYPVGDFENRYFEVEIEAGDTVSLTAGIINQGTEPILLRAFATNAFNPPNGGFSAAAEEDELTGPTLWIDFPSETFELAPQESRQTQFTVTVPEDTAPGQYVAALVVRTEGSLAISGSDMFDQIVRSAISVEIMVPGPVTSGFELGTPVFSSDADVRFLNIPITNTGNILLKPKGELSLTTPEGNEILTSVVEMGSIYGGSSTSIQIALPNQLPLGDYLVSLELADEATGTNASIDAIPVTLAEVVPEEKPTFIVDLVSITPNAEPVQFANVSATITNNAQGIPTANVTLNVQRDGQEVESYPLAQNQALHAGSTDFTQRYIPIDGWQSGTYTFQLVITSVSGRTETVLTKVDVDDVIVVP